MMYRWIDTSLLLVSPKRLFISILQTDHHLQFHSTKHSPFLQKTIINGINDLTQEKPPGINSPKLFIHATLAFLFAKSELHSSGIDLVSPRINLSILHLQFSVAPPSKSSIFIVVWMIANLNGWSIEDYAKFLDKRTAMHAEAEARF